MPDPKKKLLFIHQNFPGQFTHVVAELVRQGYEVVALSSRQVSVAGVRTVCYEVPVLAQASPVLPLRDFERQVVRAGACAQMMQSLLAQGFQPDVIVAHPGWGEALYCKDIWPGARLVIYAEYFYSAAGADFGFDREFFVDSLKARMRLRLKNTVHLQALSAADAIYAPTLWQRSQLPAEYQQKTQVAFDGIDTALVRPQPGVRLALSRDRITLSEDDEVITFVNRNLEPYRGFHIFMRALPEIMARRPQAHCLIVGRDSVSYGAAPKGGGTWREAMLREVGAALPMERIHFLGSLPFQDYLKVLQISACHVYLTYPFVLSWSCLEAMSAGRVVVASRTGPLQELVEHGANGLLADFFDVPALARQVVEVLANRQGHAHLGRAARQTIVTRYDLNARCLPMQMGLILGTT